METQTFKIELDKEMAEYFSQPPGEDGNSEAYDLHMGILELSVSLGNFTHDVEKSLNYIAASNTTLKCSFDLELLNDFRIKFEQMEQGMDPEERALHDTRGNLFMRLYNELADKEPDEIKRCEFLKLFYDLFDSNKAPQESPTSRIEVSDSIHGQDQRIREPINRIPDAKEICSDSKIYMYLESKIFRNEANTHGLPMILDLNKEICYQDKKEELCQVHTEIVYVEGYSLMNSYAEIITCPMGIKIDYGIAILSELKFISAEPKNSKTDLKMETISSNVHENNISILSDDYLANISLINLHVEGYSLIESNAKMFTCSMAIRIDNGIAMLSELNDISAEPKDSKTDLKMETISSNVHENNISIASDDDLANISLIDVHVEGNSLMESYAGTMTCPMGIRIDNGISFNYEVILAVDDYVDCVSSMEPVDSSSKYNFIVVSSVVPNEQPLKSVNEQVIDSNMMKGIYDGTEEMNDELPEKVEVSNGVEDTNINSLIFDEADALNDPKNETYSTFADDLSKINKPEKPEPRTSINSDFNQYDSNRSTQPLPYNTTASCSMKSSYKGASKIPIRNNSRKSPFDALKNGTGKFSENQCNKITIDASSEPVEMDNDGKSTLQEIDLKSPKLEDQTLSQLRQAVSDVKVNILKEVDKSLEVTFKKSSDILLSNSSREIVKSEVKNFCRNSRFTDELRLQHSETRSQNIYRHNNSATQNKSCKSLPNASPRRKLNKSSPKFIEKNQTARLNKKMVKCDDDPDDINSPRDINDNCKDCSLAKNSLDLKTSPEKSEQFFAEEGNKESTQSFIELEQYVRNSINDDIADQIEDLKDLSLSTYKLCVDSCGDGFDLDNHEKISPTCSQINQTVRDIRLNVLDESGQRLCGGGVQKSEDLSPLSLRIDEYTELRRRINPGELMEFVDEKVISPTLSQISQRSNLVKLQVLKTMDEVLSNVSALNNTIIDEEVKIDTPMLVESLCEASNEDLNINISEGISDISPMPTPGHPPDDQDELSPILGQISKTVSDVKINILNEVDKSLSEITLRSVSAILKKRKFKEYFSNQHNQDLDYTTDECTLLNLSGESVVNLSPSRNVDTFISEWTQKNPSDAILGKQFPKYVRHTSETSELSECSEKRLLRRNSNQILYLCKSCNVKVNYSEVVDKYFSEGLCISKKKCKVAERNDLSNLESKSRSKWHHKRYVIAAPRAIIKSFKSNPAYGWSPDDPNAPDFYEQLDQFVEVTGQKKYRVDCDIITASLQPRLSRALKCIIRQAPKNTSYPDLITIVGVVQLEQLLTKKERAAYESLRWHLRDKGDQDLSAESLFTDALHGMMGYGSPHLKLSSLTGRLLLRSPHHQDSISESYLLLAFGHLGYFYRELKEHQVRLAEQGDTAVALRKCLQKYLLNFHQFYDVQKRNPSSLLSLYRRTRDFQRNFEWLLEVFNNVQKAESIVVYLYEESSRRTGYQRNLLLKWLKLVIQPFIYNLHIWFLNGRLPYTTNRDMFFIEQTKYLKIDEFWEKRYRITESFSGIFDLQLSEILIGVGKTVEYSEKYLGINVESCVPRNEVRCMLIETFDKLIRYGDQEPLYNFVRNLHLEISSKVLKHLRMTKTNPEYLFSELHKYIMLTDLNFTMEFINALESVLGEPESSFDIQLFNEIKNKMLHKPVPDIYIDKSESEGSRCWSKLILRWRISTHWRALLGEDSKAYEVIFTAMWRFHYVNYVLNEGVHRKQILFRKHIECKYFEGLNDTLKCFSKLINACMRLMNVLREYFLDYLLEPAFARLLWFCKNAITVDELLVANRKYLKTITLGSLQSKNLRKYLERLYDLILQLDNKQRKFLSSCQITVEYVIRVRKEQPQNIFSTYYRERMLQFRWTCQNYSDVINELHAQFDSAMINFLLSLQLADEDLLRGLAKRLDPDHYYMEKDNRLDLVQYFEFRRKLERKRSL
ncbi:uncharacterized protein LOC117150543 [Drosophila mauritiana]|uniref:Uncharacterized protein LOC117150543 n=1 Tax=Drosophila mauritiana TaxID=7226 RepID=A0A6P8KSS5_DROMA|nr:uncharacterized protein LOC117150543 [Drosophila mauritiana]